MRCGDVGGTTGLIGDTALTMPVLDASGGVAIGAPAPTAKVGVASATVVVAAGAAAVAPVTMGSMPSGASEAAAGAAAATGAAATGAAAPAPNIEPMPCASADGMEASDEPSAPSPVAAAVPAVAAVVAAVPRTAGAAAAAAVAAGAAAPNRLAKKGRKKKASGKPVSGLMVRPPGISEAIPCTSAGETCRSMRVPIPPLRRQLLGGQPHVGHCVWSHCCDHLFHHLFMPSLRIRKLASHDDILHGA